MKERFIVVMLMLGPCLALAQELPVPQGLQAEIVNGDSQRHIQLTWNKEQDSGNAFGYNLLVKFPYSSSLLLYQKAGVIYDTVYQFHPGDGISSAYEFALMSISNFPTVKRSKACSAIRVITPSTMLPNIEIMGTSYKNGTITLGWDYDTSIRDLKGYIIYLDNKAIANLNSSEQMSWSAEFTEKGNYVFEISAITASGLESRRSQKRLIKIE